jgi:diguanylate cyclase (GGDEF)-like protein/PAS domain S-box-containing protein
MHAPAPEPPLAFATGEEEDTHRLLPHDPAASPVEVLDVLTRCVGTTIAVIRRDLHFHYANESFAAWFGMQPHQLIGMHMRDVYGEYNHARYMPLVERALRGESIAYERQVRNPQGEDSWRTILLNPWTDAKGEIVGFVASAMNVDELKRTTEALRVANQRLSSHIDNSPLALIELDADLRMTDFSPRAEQLFGWAHAEIGGDMFTRLLGDDPREHVALRMAFKRLQIGEEVRNRAEAAIRRHDDPSVVVHTEWFNSALTDSQGHLVSIMSLVEDVTARVQAAERLRHIALHDSLTGLPNRAALQAQVESSLARAQRDGEMIALLFIDLDGFKKVNDNHGHAAGDEVLREVARRLCASVRDSDMVSRLGGDEFVVLLDHLVDEQAPDIVCNRIFAALEPVIEFTGGVANIGASIGMATYPPLESRAELLLKRADAAMYQAKRAGKGCVRRAEEPIWGSAGG